MTPAEFDRVKEALAEALRQPAGARLEVLHGALDGDADLVAEARSLLGAHEEAARSGFLEEPALASEPELRAEGGSPEVDLPVGRRIGPYRVVGELGRGGMGIVVKAVRADDAFEKTVAIKVFPGGGLSSVDRQRFLEERQILARLEHPNIARLLDGGTTEEGLPYLVMELVEGERIDRYCDGRALGLEARLRLFLQVAGAVHHAHRNLVVHRDLKPANVLVTAEGSPRLLDFGIARLAEAGDPTLTAGRALTPAYASPEQLRGQPLGTATDVYSLGVVLYELLTGHRPLRPEGNSAVESLAAGLARDAEPPSAAVGRTRTLGEDGQALTIDPEAMGHARGTTSRALRRRLRGDLDNIVLTALRHDPAARYGSAEAFAEDVERFLSGRPIRARPPTRRYRAGKFVRRNPWLVIAVGTALLLLGAGVAATTWQARRAEAQRARAERRFAEVRTLAHTLLFEVHDAVAPLPGSIAAREVLVRRGLEYLDRLAGEAQDDRSLRIELASAYQRVGDVQGGTFMANLGDVPGALRSYRKAIALAGTGQGADPEARRVLSAALRAASSTEAVSGDPASARRDAEQALALSRSQPDDGAAGRTELARSCFAVGFAAFHGGDLAASRIALTEQVRLLEELHAEAPADGEVAGLLAGGHWSLGGTLWTTGESGEAARHYQRARELQEALLASEPRSGRIRRQLAYTVEALGALLGEGGESSRSVALLDRAVELRRRLAEDDPKDADARVNVLAAEKNLAIALAGAGRAGEAEALVEGVLRRSTAMLGREPGTRRLRVVVAEALGASSFVHRQRASRGGPAIRSQEQVAEREDLVRARSAWRSLEADGRLNPGEQRTLAQIEERLAALVVLPAGPDDGR